MKRKSREPLAFKIDKLTNSIENTATEEIFATQILRVLPQDANLFSTTNWLFDWEREMRTPNREVYALTTVENPSIYHGLVCFSDKGDHIFMHLIESASFNRGRWKQYLGVSGNLVAYGCKLSFDRGYEGNLMFEAKTQLIAHYESSLGAKRFAGYRMFLDTPAARRLVDQYFKEQT